MKQYQKIISGALILAMLNLYAGCASMAPQSSARPAAAYQAYYQGELKSIEFFQRLEYDTFSRPVLSKPLKIRPTKNGAVYYARVMGADDVPVGIFKLGVVGRNYQGLLYTISFRYSEDGFDMGEKVLEGVARTADPLYAGDFVLLVGSATVLFTTLTGFTIDLIFNTTNLSLGLYKELTRENEIRMAYTRLRYDSQKRLRSATLFALSQKDAVPLAESGYWYEDQDSEPYKAVRRILAREHKPTKSVQTGESNSKR